MNIEQAKQIKLSDFLYSLGYKPSKQQVNVLWYKSPLRDENHPSFTVNPKENRWWDYGLNDGGNILKLAMYLYNSDKVSYLLNQIEKQSPHIRPVSFSFPKQSSYSDSYDKLDIVPLSSPALLYYLRD